MFATLASPEEFRPFVANFDRDIVRMNTFSKYSDAAIDIAARLAKGVSIKNVLTNIVIVALN
jgi:hypothetical protein